MRLQLQQRLLTYHYDITDMYIMQSTQDAFIQYPFSLCIHAIPTPLHHSKVAKSDHRNQAVSIALMLYAAVQSSSQLPSILIQA